MERIYLDNAATSYPKPPQVVQKMMAYMNQIGANVGRGGYQTAYAAGGVVLDTREHLAAFFGFQYPSHVLFTPNVTFSLNLLLKGLLKPGDHLLVSSMEHNAVMRPLNQLTGNGISFDRIPCDSQGRLLLEGMESLLKPNTKGIVMTHASNVCGTLLPIEQVGKFCKAHNLFFGVDCAQTAGSIPINMEEMCIDALAFTGHKGLMGPQGIGGLLIHPKLAEKMEPLVVGGTGSFSHQEEVPTLLPDRFEGGTLNLPGIYGLNAALEFLEQTGIQEIQEQERALTDRFLKGAASLTGVQVVGTGDASRSSGMVSLVFPHLDQGELAFLLDSQYGIMTRCGLHCAPNAHKTLGTYPKGTIRFSFGYFNTAHQIDYTLEALEQILKERG